MKPSKLVSALALAFCLSGPAIQAQPQVAEHRVTPDGTLQSGSSFHEYLLCVYEARIAGSPWSTSFEVCQSDPAIHAQPDSAKHDVTPLPTIQSGSWVNEYLLCVYEARIAGSPWSTSFEVCQSDPAIQAQPDSAEHRVTPDGTLQSGSSVHEYLLCVYEARIAGSPWSTSFEVCQSDLPAVPRNPLSHRS